VNLEKARERLDAKIAAWSLLDKDEEGRFADLPKLKKIKELNEAKLGDKYKVDLEHGIMRFLPDASRINAWLNSKQDESEDDEPDDGKLNAGKSKDIKSNDDESKDGKLKTPSNWNRDRQAGFSRRVAEVRTGRRMFRTQKNYLGMGPRSAQAGDQVWILPGANVPFILRPLAVETNYQLIGEAYVHGIMKGEALVEVGEQDIHRVVIV